MNYLSHYYIDHIPGNYYFNGALFLPDFARNYTRNFDNSILDLTPNELQLQLGCVAHLEADKIFHPCEFFKKYTEILLLELNNYKPLAHINRKWFLAHILFEMWLDRLLIKTNINIVHAFYNDLEKIDTKVLTNFVLRFSNKNIVPLIIHFKNFCNAKYLYGYAQNESFVYAISRVYKNGTLYEMTLEDKELLKKFLILMEERHFKEPISILAALKMLF